MNVSPRADDDRARLGLERFARICPEQIGAAQVELPIEGECHLAAEVAGLDPQGVGRAGCSTSSGIRPPPAAYWPLASSWSTPARPLR